MSGGSVRWPTAPQEEPNFDGVEGIQRKKTSWSSR